MGTLRQIELSDEMLVERAALGDERALGTLFHRHARYVAGVAFRLLGRDAEVDDVVQDTFLAAGQHLASLRSASAVRPWLARIAAREACRRINSRSRLRRFFEGVRVTSAPHSEPNSLHPVSELAHALDQLPAELRIPWVLHHVEGETLPAVASLARVSLATIKRRIAEADVRLGRRER